MKTHHPVLTLSKKNETGSDVAASLFITPAGTVATAGAVTLGVTEYLSKNGGDMAVISLGVAVVKSGGAITAGQRVVSDATGRAVAAVAASVAVTVPSGATAVTSDAAQPNLVETIGATSAYLPYYVAGVALDAAGGANEFIRVKLT